MTREQQDKRFKELLEQAAAIRSRKNKDYGTDEDSLSNLRECERMGIPAWKGTLIRIGDKFSRIQNLARTGEISVKEESVLDTLFDMSVYCLLAIILFEEAEKKV